MFPAPKLGPKLSSCVPRFGKYSNTAVSSTYRCGDRRDHRALRFAPAVAIDHAHGRTMTSTGNALDTGFAPAACKITANYLRTNCEFTAKFSEKLQSILRTYNHSVGSRVILQRRPSELPCHSQVFRSGFSQKTLQFLWQCRFSGLASAQRRPKLRCAGRRRSGPFAMKRNHARCGRSTIIIETSAVIVRLLGVMAWAEVRVRRH
jgi:hypothetical protein